MEEGEFKKVLEEKSKNNESIVIMLFRLRQSTDQFNKASSKYSRIIIFLTIIMSLIAMLQIILFLF